MKKSYKVLYCINNEWKIVDAVSLNAAKNHKKWLEFIHGFKNCKILKLKEQQ